MVPRAVMQRGSPMRTPKGFSKYNHQVWTPKGVTNRVKTKGVRKERNTSGGSSGEAPSSVPHGGLHRDGPQGAIAAEETSSLAPGGGNTGESQR